eukprot:CAMPEP_0202406236 /NCGR_PEP_ID=MMETSP1128-20130828/8802_1 /ASSEMBLY_ACC=CAM_ASM_000463 /TAXON_ID=3047 /ORGANISM="Dunaliella tertiolecta, Strain CCMP1320" /LENGTH=135 /DNA_ID=CAMNT_0049011025 /DNA_START=88 /DNA_END=496 /DNA_ORIENTATION=+
MGTKVQAIWEQQARPAAGPHVELRQHALPLVRLLHAVLLVESKSASALLITCASGITVEVSHRVAVPFMRFSKNVSQAQPLNAKRIRWRIAASQVCQQAAALVHYSLQMPQCMDSFCVPRQGLVVLHSAPYPMCP